jgi:tetratricopeptide (TPR) repeat protein
MRHSARLFGLMAGTALIVSASQVPGLSGEFRHLTAQAVAQTTQADDPATVESGRGGYRLVVTEANRDEARKAEADRLLWQGIEQYQASQFREALQSWEQALAIYREIKDQAGESNALGNLGVAYRELGQYWGAIDLYEQALSIFREVGDQVGEGRALGNLGTAYHNLGQYQQAIDYYEQYLAIARKIGNRQGEGDALGNFFGHCLR